MSYYKIDTPTKIYFGREILEETLKKEEKLFCGNLLIVTTGRSLRRYGYIDNLLEKLEKLSNVNRVDIYENVSANPRLNEVQEATELGIKCKADVVIGFGGGSALDAAKATAAAIGMKQSIKKLFRQKIEPDKRTLPIIAIPTTAGTGSELSKAAIITDEEECIKSGIRGESLFPVLAIVDSKFTESVPYNITMETGFDVLAHAMESYVSKAATPFTRGLSEQAIRIVGKELIKLSNNLEDKEARAQMSYASMIMGINLGNASTALPHRLQYPIGAHTQTSHGAGLAALYPSWIYYQYIKNPFPTKQMLLLLTEKEIGNAQEAADTIKEFIKKLKLPTNLWELGISEKMIMVFAQEVSGNLLNDVVAESEDIVQKIYRKALLE